MSNKSELIAVRLPLELIEKIKVYGLENYPKDETFDKTKTIIDLIEKGLINQSQNNNNYTVIQDVIQSVNTNDSNNLENYIDEIKESQNAINDKIYQRLEAIEKTLNKDNFGLTKFDYLQSEIDGFNQDLRELREDLDRQKSDFDDWFSEVNINSDEIENNLIKPLEKRIEALENQLNQEVKPLIDDNKKNETAPPVINDEKLPADQPQKPVNLSKFYPNQKIFKPYHIKQFEAIYDLLTGFNIAFLSTNNSDVIQQWIIADQDGNKAGLFLNGASHWSLGKVNFGDPDLKGFFEDCNFNDNYLDDLLIANNIDLDEIIENYDQVGTSQDSPDPSDSDYKSQLIAKISELKEAGVKMSLRFIAKSLNECNFPLPKSSRSEEWSHSILKSYNDKNGLTIANI